MKNRLPVLLWDAIIFIAFVVFSYLVHKNLFTQLDFDTTVRLQNKIPAFMTTPFSVLSLLASFEIVSVFLLFLWVFIRKLKYIFVLFLFGFFHLLELYGKAFVAHPGPPYLFFRYDIPFQFPTSYVQPGSSYPSGHLARTLFVSVILAFILYSSRKLSRVQKQLLYCLIVIIVGAMFVSRIYLGEHWLSDVIGGSLLGTAMGLMSLIFI
ncbi:MAG TPA: phosphatase PAP2 family protein [Patescibacteria group bacterium]|jgi:membrane-associated phospholipid phosphatase|nr:phosphatase PAP2 family protein [Patescibacteria group bacterium]